MNPLHLQVGPYALTLYRPVGACEGAVYIPMNGDPSEIAALLPDCPSALIFISGFDWNRDLSPWPAKAVFGEENFGGQADAFLNELTGRIIPAAEQALDIRPEWRGIAGYSLAGLFAVYAAFRTDVFTRIASASGSMWYDGWMDFARSTPLSAPITRACFSVGAKEKKTRNPRMQPVEENTRAMCALLAGRGADSSFVLHPGNHFTDADKRLAEAIGRLTR